MIKDGVEEMEGDQDEHVDLVGMIASENFQMNAEEFMVKSANLHKEFWMELREDKPDLKKLNLVGSRVTTAINNAKDYWNRLQKYSPTTQFLKIYGKFLIEIQNEKSGEEFIKKYLSLPSRSSIYHLPLARAKQREKREQEIKKFKENEKTEGELDTATSEPLPYVIVSGKEVKPDYHQKSS